MYGIEQRERLFEISLRLAREADDHVSGQAELTARPVNPADLLEVLLARVGAAHFAQDARRTGLHRQMDVVAERWCGIDRFDDLAREVIWMRGSEAHAANSFDLCHGQQQLDKIPFARRWIAVGIHRLAEQLNLRVAAIGEAPNLRENRIAGPAAFRAACVRHHTIRTGIVAAFDDREVRAKRIIAARDFSLECFVGVEIEARHAAPA